jgi:hypothetical protein
MGKGGYIGAHTVVVVRPDGTHWPPDEKPPRAEENTYDPWDRRDQTELSPKERRTNIRKKKLESKFVAACAAAFVEGTLSQTHPEPPADLRKEVKFCGGNTDWLSTNRDRLNAFTKSARGQGWQQENGG